MVVCGGLWLWWVLVLVLFLLVLFLVFLEVDAECAVLNEGLGAEL